MENWGWTRRTSWLLVELRLNKDVKVYGDAVASIKSAGLIGDRYISIDPGGAEEVLKPGATITQTQPPLDIEELVGKYAFGEVKKKDEP